MGQVPIQTGVRVKDGSYRTSYPVNLQQKLIESGVSKGELISTRGAVLKGTGPGNNRGAVEWNGTHYRVMGPYLCTIDAEGTATTVATLADDGLPVRFAISFDRLGICSAAKLYYWDLTTFTEVTDTDLLPVLDLAWEGGYFITTDGTSLVVTELNDPTSVDPLKYGSAESDPDPITGVEILNEELVGFGRYSIQFFRNVGGTGFPFQTVVGATIPFGCVGPHAKCRVADTLAFVGSAKDEPVGVYIMANGSALRVSDEEIDERLKNADSTTTMEWLSFGFEQQIIVHLADCSVALALKSSQAADAGLWHILQGRDGVAYGPRNALWHAGQHWVADGASIGVLDPSTAALFGEEPGWGFDAGLIYNDGNALILQEVRLAGQFPPAGTTAFFSITYDGETYSREIARRLQGYRNEPCLWRANTRVPALCGLHFRGFGKVAIARANVSGEPLDA